MSDSIVVNVISPEVTNINVNDTGENIYINPLTLNQGIINHSVTHQSGGSDELLHNLLGGLQGGSSGNYYHLTSGEYANLVTGAVVRPSDTGAFYPNSNPSGFITGVDLSAYVTGDVVRPSETGSFITASQTGAFYPRSNPSGFITGVDLSAYVTGEVVRPSETGVFYLASNPSGFITGVDLSAYVTGSVVRPSETGDFINFNSLTGDRGDVTVTGNSPSNLNFSIDNSAITSGKIADSAVTTAKIANFNVTTDKLGSLAVTTNIIATNAVTNTKLADMASQRIKGRISAGTSDPEDLTASQVRTLINFDDTVSGLLSGYVTGSVVRPSETGSFITNSQTGAFYAASNPSGFITGVDLSAYVTGDVVRPNETGIFITQSQTGLFYASNNPSGFITGVDLSFSGNYYTKSESESRYVNTTGTETILGDKTFHDRVYINNLYVTGLETIVNTTNTNVASNFILLNLTGGAVDGGLFFVTGAGLTGINDSGAILGFDHSDKFKFGIGTRASDLSVLNTIASVEEMTGISGNLQTQISSLSNATGSYVLNSQTGAFYPTSNPSGFATLSDPVRTTVTGNGATSIYAISGAGSLVNPSALIVAIDGALQEPGADYGVSGGNIIFTSPLESGAKAVVISPVNTVQVGQVTPSDGSVTSAKLANDIEVAGQLTVVGQPALSALSNNHAMTYGLSEEEYGWIDLPAGFANLASTGGTVSPSIIGVSIDTGGSTASFSTARARFAGFFNRSPLAWVGGVARNIPFASRRTRLRAIIDEVTLAGNAYFWFGVWDKSSLTATTDEFDNRGFGAKITPTQLIAQTHDGSTLFESSPSSLVLSNTVLLEVDYYQQNLSVKVNGQEIASVSGGYNIDNTAQIHLYGYAPSGGAAGDHARIELKQLRYRITEN